MSMDHLEEQEKLAAGDTGVDQQSIMDRLRKAREEIESETTIDLDIPNYRGLLVARYHLMTNDEITKIGQRIRRQFSKAKDQQAAIVLAFSCDGLIAACDGLFYRDEEGEIYPITTGDGLPMTYSTPESLGSFLNLEASSAREAVIEVFGGPDHDTSVVDHYMKVIRWMRDTGADVSSDLLGEL